MDYLYHHRQQLLHKQYFMHSRENRVYSIANSSLAANNNMMLHEMDVKTTFLNRIFEEEMYMRQPAAA